VSVGQRNKPETFNKYCLLKQCQAGTQHTHKGYDAHRDTWKPKTSKNPHSKRLCQKAANVVINVKMFVTGNATQGENSRIHNGPIVVKFFIL